MLGALILSATIVATAGWAVARASAQGAGGGRGDVADRALRLLGLFAAGVAAAAADPKAFLVWEPLARVARAVDPEAMGSLDRAAGGRFPFSVQQMQAAHARWSADWLAWEHAHDAEYKLKAAAIEETWQGTAPSAVGRARLDAVEREKLGRYQQRYEEYTRVSRALQVLVEGR